MKPVRVLIVDDSAVVRKLLSNLLAADPEIEVAGTAGNGHQALTRIPEVKPDPAIRRWPEFRIQNPI